MTDLRLLNWYKTQDDVGANVVMKGGEIPWLITWYDDRGDIHRAGGPAVVDRLGAIEWWLRGKRYYERNLYFSHSGMSNEELMILQLRWPQLAGTDSLPWYIFPWQQYS